MKINGKTVNANNLAADVLKYIGLFSALEGWVQDSFPGDGMEGKKKRAKVGFGKTDSTKQ